MKFGIPGKFIVVFLGFVFLNGCSSCNESPSTNTEANATTKVITPKRATNVSVPGNANANNPPKPYPGMKPGENPTLDNSKVRVIDTNRAAEPPPARKMPDNSEMTTIMNSKGQVVETRRFLNHPQLGKIERITRTPKDVIVKVYLRNGKVLELPDKKIKDYRIDNALQILTAAGVKVEKTIDPNAPTKKDTMGKRPIVKGPVSNDN